MPNARQQGFTLIELSIVLVIIGLLVGGVLGGQSLIKAARLQSVITDVNKFSTAINTFVEKYNAYPGDMANATDYWGADASCPTTPTNTVRKQATCNGNGNSRIDTWPENFRAWQQLADAGLIEGSYTGVSGAAGTATSDSVAGQNVPASRLPGGLYTMIYDGQVTGNAAYFDSDYGTVLYFGGYEPDQYPHSQIFSTQEALSIDRKIDDGLPASGSVMTWKHGVFDYCASTTDSTAVYDMTQGGAQCSLLFKMGF